jgi:hypothetical protein
MPAYTVRDLVGFAIGQVPVLSAPAAKDIVKRAWEDLVAETSWGFLYRRVSVTNGSTSITFDATALAALNAVETTLRPIVGRQFRGPNFGELSTITAYNDITGVATLDREWDSDTAAALSSWTVFKAYYTPPGGEDHQDFDVVVNIEEGYRLRKNFTQQDLARRDPQRASMALAYVVSFLDFNDPTIPGAPRFELWPHQGSEASLEIVYFSKGLTDHNGVAFPSDSYVFPLPFSTSLLRAQVEIYAYEWAETHKGEHEQLQASNWRFRISQKELNLARLLARAKIDDERVTQAGWLADWRNLPLAPVDSNFAQSHDVDWLWPGF